MTVSAPTTTTPLASLTAIRLGKHVYCQKPLTHTVFEARVLQEAAKKYGVCTQMGNQGSAGNGLRRAVELWSSLGSSAPTKRSMSGPTGRPNTGCRPPRSPSGPTAPTSGPGRSTGITSSAAPLRPFVKEVYHPMKWRGFWDFGTGAIGDMACHTANMAFRALKLAHPVAVSAESGEVNPETYPAWARVKLEFPAREGMPPVTLTWYEGSDKGKRVLPPEDLLAKLLNPGEKVADSGSILVGEKGVLFSPNDYGAEFRLTPKGLAEGKNLSTPERLPANGGGDQGMKNEWVEAIKSSKPELAYSNFDIASLLTEAFLLGNVAVKTGKVPPSSGTARA